MGERHIQAEEDVTSATPSSHPGSQTPRQEHQTSLPAARRAHRPGSGPLSIYLPPGTCGLSYNIDSLGVDVRIVRMQGDVRHTVPMG